MDERHRQMWQVVREPEQVAEAFASASPWSAEARGLRRPLMETSALIRARTFISLQGCPFSKPTHRCWCI